RDWQVRIQLRDRLPQAVRHGEWILAGSNIESGSSQTVFLRTRKERKWHDRTSRVVVLAVHYDTDDLDVRMNVLTPAEGEVHPDGIPPGEEFPRHGLIDHRD